MAISHTSKNPKHDKSVGTFVVTLKEGKNLKEDDVMNAVKDAGFKAIEVRTAGTELVSKSD